MDALVNYFQSEKNESLLFVAIGVIASAIAAYVFIALRGKFYLGLAVPLLLIGLIQIVVGGTVFLRTDNQVKTLQNEIAKAPEQAAKTEIVRMKTVMKNFAIYKYVEVAFVIFGTLFILLLRNREIMLGLGIGMLLQGALMLSADIFAERRGEHYLNFLNTLTHEQNISS